MKERFAKPFLFFLIIAVFTPPTYAAEGFFSWLFSVTRKKEIEPVSDAQYNEECGACHFPYQPGWLPEASWRKLLDAQALQDHFGDNAELDEAVRKHILEFLVANSADKSWYKRSRKVMVSLDKGEAPLRITEVPYIKRKHEDIPKEVLQQSNIKSLSFCNKCHRRATDADFDDDTVLIPK